MAKADLHVHSRFSDHPSEWFLQRIGASESYTEPAYIYDTAKRNGMQFVTVTDHNAIDGARWLRDRHPNDVFVSTEATAYFPEDKCKIHVLVYGIDEDLFGEVQRLRTNIYDLRDWLKTEGIAHSVAHATYSVNNKLTPDHLERLILLFDTFEGINGGRSRLNNHPWEMLLRNLTPEHIERLRDRHDIIPASDTPWLKGFTGGSDDHAGLFIGKTYTNAQASSINDFLDSIRHKRSTCEGRYSDFQSLAFTIYKIAYEFSKTKSNHLSQSLASQITERLFDSTARPLKTSWKFKTYKAIKRRKKDTENLKTLYLNLYENITTNGHIPIEERLDEFYDQLALISDEFFRILLTSFEKSVRKGDLLGLVKNFSSSLPGIFLTIPFFSTLQHFFRGRHITGDLAARMCIKTQPRSKRILWFSDTVTYMNGVSMTVKKISWLSYLNGRDITLVTSIPEEEVTSELPPNMVNLAGIFDFSLPHYEHYRLRAPSLLQSIKQLHSYEPDEIYISTPGPVGLFGVLAARMLNAKSVAVFHTDFTEQAHLLIDDSTVENLVEHYLKWFNSLVDEVRVPTAEYIDILGRRDYDTTKMSVFRRGIDTFQFIPKDTDSGYLTDQWKLPDGITFMYAGRISKDKSLDVLIDAYLALRKERPDLNLIIAGEGPDLDSLRKTHKNDPRILLTGNLGHDVLPNLYSASHGFVFPSATDTFGMVVLEAQSCGLPAIVSDIGGPKEIIAPEDTGYVVPFGDRAAWTAAIARMVDLIDNCPDEYQAMRERSRQRVIDNHDWNKVLSELTMFEYASSESESLPANAADTPRESDGERTNVGV